MIGNFDHFDQASTSSSALANAVEEACTMKLLRDIQALPGHQDLTIRENLKGGYENPVNVWMRSPVYQVLYAKTWEKPRELRITFRYPLSKPMTYYLSPEDVLGEIDLEIPSSFCTLIG